MISSGIVRKVRHRCAWRSRSSNAWQPRNGDVRYARSSPVARFGGRPFLWVP